MLQLTFNPGLTLTGFRTTRPSRLFDFFALWSASDVSSTEFRLQVNCDLMTFGDTLRDGSRLTSLMEHFSLNIHAIHLSFTFTGNVLT